MGVRGGGGGYNDLCNYFVFLFMVILEVYNGKKKKNYLCYVLNDLY